MTKTSRQRAISEVRPRIAIADKNPVVRLGLKDFIVQDGRFDLVKVMRYEKIHA